MAQFNALNLLSGAPKGLRPSEISSSLVVYASSTTYLLDRMEALGFVRRGSDARDRRANRVVLTRKGRQLHAALLPAYETALGHLGQGLTPIEKRSVFGTLARLQSAAGPSVTLALQVHERERRKLQ
ncbi:MarR family winged helix-turn-helix transcriptional regulator [Nibricoccus sp. IMCC34717]|uniref:MarR family winged helix-turn-helix transcriptional regulator n=1 Tax=Nibricoccus sp. IMCC34717 TaxID=3034021 RepID=UPI00384E5A4B